MSKGTRSSVLFGITLLGISPIESNVSQWSYEKLRLDFPVSGYTHTTAQIRNVFDHSMDGPYYVSAKVLSYTGEEGSFRIDDEGCMAQESNRTFRINGNYVGTSHGPAVLCYDAHPSYDFAAKEGTPVRAAASGFIRHPVFYHKLSARMHNTVEIQHPGTSCSTLYLHMNKNFFSNGKFVQKGQVIGTVGDIGTSDFYLHFEVQCNDNPVDPYGWEGKGPDPYYIANTVLWD